MKQEYQLRHKIENCFNSSDGVDVLEWILNIMQFQSGSREAMVLWQAVAKAAPDACKALVDRQFLRAQKRMINVLDKENSPQ
jgi:hypothetical protein